MSAVLVMFAQVIWAAEVDGRTVVLDSVEALKKPVTLTMRAAALKEVIANVQTTTGARLRVSRDIAEDKATLRVKNLPAKEVLRQLARCFDLCWSEKQDDSGIYLYLWMDKQSVDNMSRRELDDYLAITKQFDDQMSATSALVVRDMKFDLSDVGMRSVGPDEYDKLRLRETATRSKSTGAAVMQYIKLTDAQRKNLLNGKHVTISGSAIASDALQKWPEAQSLDYWVECSLGGYLLKCARLPEDGQTRLLATAVFDDSRYDKTIDAANVELAKDESLKKDFVAKPGGMPIYENKTAVRTDPEPLIKIQSKYLTVQKPGEGSAATPITMSDGLLEVAEALGVPFVAQYISEYNGLIDGTGQLAPAATSAKNTLDRIAQLEKLHKFVVERDGEFLLAKSLLWHRMRQREVPEATIKRWQAEITALDEPTWAAAIEIASLNWWQLRGIMNIHQPLFGSTNILQLAQCEYALKLYGSLSAEQRRAVDSGEAISVRTFSDAQRLLFMQGYELMQQPTYKDAQDPNWLENATFAAADRTANYDLFAISGMEQLGSIDMLAELQAAKEAGLIDESKDEDARIQSILNGSITKLQATLADKYPNVSSRKISFYMTRSRGFTFAIGSNGRGADVFYSAKVR
jgi:hypothetical protein